MQNVGFLMTQLKFSGQQEQCTLCLYGHFRGDVFANLAFWGKKTLIYSIGPDLWITMMFLNSVDPDQTALKGALYIF